MLGGLTQPVGTLATGKFNSCAKLQSFFSLHALLRAMHKPKQRNAYCILHVYVIPIS